VCFNRTCQVRSRDAYPCVWRPCQQALPYLLPRMRRRCLVTADEGWFAAVLAERGTRADGLQAQAAAEAVLRASLETCRPLQPGAPSDADRASAESVGAIEPGGAVLSLLGGGAAAGKGASARGGRLVASVAVVMMPGGALAVWCPKEEVTGLLELLHCSEP
jgi:hypothetical protein